MDNQSAIHAPTIEKKREEWVDTLKLLACILVVVGHFFQSMVSSGILRDGPLLGWFDTILHFFIVQLFFICSGYLYQKYTRIENAGDWFINVIKKILALGIPYVVFSTLTWLLKIVFSPSVNEQAGSLWEHLIKTPINQYWYLYALLLIFIITPTVKKKSGMIILLLASLVIKILSIIFLPVIDSITPLKYITQNELWFTLGMAAQYFHFSEKVNEKSSSVSAFVGLFAAIILSVLGGIHDFHFWIQEFVLCFIISISLAILAIRRENHHMQTGMEKLLIKHIMPIYLMHTMFAATARILLMKIGVFGPMIHTLIGIPISFFGPILAMKIAEKIKIIDFVVYPTKYINVGKKKTASVAEKQDTEQN